MVKMLENLIQDLHIVIIGTSLKILKLYGQDFFLIVYFGFHSLSGHRIFRGCTIIVGTSFFLT